MTEQDRGAYAPPSDAPLTFETFDARSRPRTPMPMTLIGSVVVLAVLGAAAFMFYRSGSHDAAPPPVGAAIGPIKTAPAAGAQPRDPGAALDVYSPQNVPNSPPMSPVLAAPPEQPLPRPAPKPLPAVAAPAPGLKVEAVKPAPVHLAPPATKPAPKPLVAKAEPAPMKVQTAKTTIAKTETTSTTVKTAPAKVATAAASPAEAKPAEAAAPALKTSIPAATAAPASAGGTAVQIGAFSSAALAEKGYQTVSAQMSGQMGGHTKAVEPLARDGKTLYRTSVRGFADRDAAAAFCAALKAKGAACIVKG